MQKRDNYTQNAFTLAEVLITLGIIGVVAAMTIPILMTNIAGAKYRSQFKKTLSNLNQGIRTAQADYDLNFSDLTSNNCTENGGNLASEPSICAFFNSVMKGAWYQRTWSGSFTEVKKYRGNVPTDSDDLECFSSCGSIWQFNDGSTLY